MPVRIAQQVNMGLSLTTTIQVVALLLQWAMATVRLAVLLWPLRVLLLRHATLVRMKLALLVKILHVPGVVPDPLQILGPVLGHQRVLYVRRVCIHYRQTLLRVRPVVPDPLQIPGPALGQ